MRVINWIIIQNVICCLNFLEIVYKDSFVVGDEG